MIAMTQLLSLPLSELQSCRKEAQEDYVTLFEQAWNESNAGAPLSAIFHNRENKEMFPLEATNDEIIARISEEADAVVF